MQQGSGSSTVTRSAQTTAEGPLVSVGAEVPVQCNRLKMLHTLPQESEIDLMRVPRQSKYSRHATPLLTEFHCP
jgi:hypothetical protein